MLLLSFFLKTNKVNKFRNFNSTVWINKLLIWQNVAIYMFPFVANKRVI